MKLIYKIVYIDDKVEEIEVVDFAYPQDAFWVMPLNGFTRRYIKSATIHSMEHFFRSR